MIVYRALLTAGVLSVMAVGMSAGSGEARAQQGWPDWASSAFGERPAPSRRYQRRSAPPPPAQSFAAPPPVDDDDDDAKQNPKLVEGGPRPDIDADEPPIVAFRASYKPNSIVIDTRGRRLYYVLGGNRAYMYRIGVGREGFSWTGTEKISRKQSWPDWHPPAEMKERDPRLPDKMTGGLRNPLGAVALYLGNTLYRIHGTNNPKSIGRAQSSGCFRMMNEEVTHLASIAKVGTTVTVVEGLSSKIAGPQSGPKSAAAARPVAYQ